MRPFLVLVLGITALGAFLGWILSGDSGTRISDEEKLVFEPTAFGDLANWKTDDHAAALGAFHRSCAKIEQKPPDALLVKDNPVFGILSEWQRICVAAKQVEPGNAALARQFFETQFDPYLTLNNKEPTGLFTGYYEPSMRGSREKKHEGQVPVLARPDDLVMVNLGAFRKDLKGHRIAGRVDQGRLTPYESRAQIDQGLLLERLGTDDLNPIVWIDDPIDAFFLHIQGSGRVAFEDGSYMRVGYDGQNGHPYTAIGGVLVRQGALDLETVSMQSIRAWLAQHPEEAPLVMSANASYIFFRKIDIDDPALGPLGAQNVSLTPGRSLAVDLKFHGMGMPVWLETTLPRALDEPKGEPELPYHRLMIAQDTGGAIRGPVRGDVFFGFGDGPADIAGRMKQNGRMIVLLPKATPQNATK